MCHVDARWWTDKYEVMFEQQGLFKAGVSIHHALCTTGLQMFFTCVYDFQRMEALPPTLLKGLLLMSQPHQLKLGCSELPSNEWSFERLYHSSTNFFEALEAEAACLATPSAGTVACH